MTSRHAGVSQQGQDLPQAFFNPPAVNNNFGPGTFNAVNGTQVNNNNGLIIVNQCGPSTASYQPPIITSARTPFAIEQPYQDGIINIHNFSDMLGTLLVSEYSPLHTLLKEMSSLAVVVSFVAQALTIIDRIPTELRSFTYFGQVRRIANDVNTYLYTIYTDIKDYHTHLSRYEAAGFWHGFLLHIYIHYRWGALFVELQEYLRRNQLPLNRFLSLMASRADWYHLVSDYQAKLLDQLVHSMRLKKHPEIVHFPFLKIWVTDPLGQRLPIPMELCGTLSDFEIAVRLFCRNDEANKYLQRGAWEVVLPSDNTVIQKADLMKVIKPGVQLDISVLVHLMASSLSTCPRCHHDNHGRIQYNGWMECDVCHKDFRVVSSDIPRKKTVNTVPEVVPVKTSVAENT